MTVLRCAALVGFLGAGVGAEEPSIVDAAKRGDIAAVRVLVQGQADLNATSADGSTALHWAAHNGDVRMADVLLRAGADVSAASRYGITPLYLACRVGSAAVIDRLVAAGAAAAAVMPEGDTMLMTAARAGTAEGVASLIAHGADVNARERSKGQTALMWAVAENHADVVQTLIDAGADVQARSTKDYTAENAREGERTGTGLAIGRKYDAFTAFAFAARGGHIETLDVLLEAGADVNGTLPGGMSGLVLAVASARFDAAMFLLDSGADPGASEQGWTALHQLAWTRKPNTGNNNPGPVSRGSVVSLALASALLAAGADINAQVTREPDQIYVGRNGASQIGATALGLAAKNVDVPFIRFLLANGADPLIPTERGTTPMMAAAGVGIWAHGENPGTHEEAAEAVKLVLERGVDPTTVDADGNTALHGAALRGASDAVRQLVEAGAALDVRNQRGWTPFRIADGVYIHDGFKRAPETATLLRQLMVERGLDPDDATP